MTSVSLTFGIEWNVLVEAKCLFLEDYLAVTANDKSKFCDLLEK
jgi:hypothetical protein